VGLEVTLEGAQSHIWCSKFSWQTVPRSWSIDREAALTGGGPGARDQSQTPWNAVAGDHARNGPAHTGQPSSEGLYHVGTSMQLVDNSLAYWKPV